VQYSHLYIYIVPKYILFWTDQKELWPIYLCPIQFKAQIPRLAVLLVTHPFPARGVHGARRTGSNEPQRLSARSRNNLYGGYTSHDFVIARTWCAITTALQPSTSIYRGLTAVPKVESISYSKSSLSDLYWLKRRSTCRYTPHRRSKKHSWRILPPYQPPHLKHRQSPSNQVGSMASSVGIISSPRFYLTKNQSFPNNLPWLPTVPTHRYKVNFVSLNATVWHLHLLLWVHLERNQYK